MLLQFANYYWIPLIRQTYPLNFAGPTMIELKGRVPGTRLNIESGLLTWGDND